MFVPPCPPTTTVRTMIIRRQCRLPSLARVGSTHLVPAMRPGSDSANVSRTVAGTDRVKVIAPVRDDFEWEDLLLWWIFRGLTASLDSTGLAAGCGGGDAGGGGGGGSGAGEKNTETTPLAAAPTTVVSASRATEKPKKSLVAPSVSLSLPVCLRSASPVRENVYAEPCPVFLPMVSSDAPARIVSALIATEKPRNDPVVPSEADSVPFSVRALAPVRVNV